MRDFALTPPPTFKTLQIKIYEISIPAAVAVTSLIHFRRVTPGKIISPAVSWVSTPLKFALMVWANSGFYGSTVQLLYLPQVAVVGGVTLDAVSYFLQKLGF